MNILKKYIKISIVILIVIVLAFPAYYVLNKLSYRYRVDQNYAQKIKSDLQLVTGFFGKDMLYSIGWKNVHESALDWGDKLIRLNSENVRSKENSSNWDSIDSIQTSKDQGKTWDNFFVFDNLQTTFCDIAIVHNDKINCILSRLSLGFNLLIIDKDGKYTNKVINKSGMPGKEILAAYVKNNNLFLVWSDQRARFPYPDIIDPARGPHLIVAGELNLDTLEFKEHIIGYDVYTLKELFGKGKDKR